MNFTKPLQWAAVVSVLVNAAAMFSPIINGGDAVTYASIAQHIVQSGDWARLVWDGQDWLDKPHFPFWITALFFKLAGVSAWSYILPGFLFHLIGAYFTYRLARLFYGRETALLSVLLYVSILNLMDSSIEIKAEAYLTGEIMAASYYWLRYDAESRIKYLLLGALFTGMAIMTKGIFTLFTISSGLVCLWIYRREFSGTLVAKWFAALLLSLLFASPELLALYVQFGQRPDATAGGPFTAFRFFFWDSQFGRFFNTGPIQNRNGNPFYFVFVFLWGFFPWTLVFFAAVYSHVKTFARSSPSERAALIFLGSMFLWTFLMFSATKFQMGYYIDIILPFAAIVCAHFLHRSGIGRRLFVAQMGLVVLLSLLVIGLCLFVNNATLTAATALALAGLLGCAYATRTQPLGVRAVLCSVLTIDLVYGFVALLTALAFMENSIPYNAARLLDRQSAAPVYVYRMPEAARELGLYIRTPCRETDALADVTSAGKPAWLIVRHEEAQQLGLDPSQFRPVTGMQLVVHKTGTFNKLLRLAKGTWPLETIDFLQYAPR